MRREKYRCMDNTKNRKRKRKLTLKKMKRSPDERHAQTNAWHCLYRLFKYIYSLLIEKEVCDSQNILSFHVCPSSRDFFRESFLFLFLFFTGERTYLTQSERVSSFFSYFSQEKGPT